MDQLGMTERGQPAFEGDEAAMIQAVWFYLDKMIEAHRRAPVINREVVLRFCEIAERLTELVHGRPQRVKELLGIP